MRRPQSNGFIERLHRTLLDEHFRVMGRQKFYESIEEMQRDLEAYLKHYNEQRPHQGRAMGGRTPAEVFVTGLGTSPLSSTSIAAVKKPPEGGKRSRRKEAPPPSPAA